MGKTLIEKIKNIAARWEIECKTQKLDEKTREGIGRFLRLVLSCEDELESADYIISRIKQLTDNCNNHIEFLKTYHSAISENAYKVIKEWHFEECPEKILVFDDCYCRLIDPVADDTFFQLELYGIPFSGTIEECLDLIEDKLTY